ncbi:MAG: type II toxin-antitoxin system VapC family toxin [Planctomycetaceae bacterium]|nr:type II toxin-antitoxin system VapC family toxin [Planctomycetaceae bacterium]
MKLLLDTHTFLWHADGNPQMSMTATALLVDPTNELFLSMASVWEIAIKVGLKKLSLSSSYVPFMTTAITGYGLTVLPISFEDCAEYETLPFPLTKHRDPFDRLIITHARRNDLSIIGADVKFDSYGVQRLW